MAPTDYGTIYKLTSPEAPAANVWSKMWHKIKFCDRQVNIIIKSNGTVAIP
jgi:hypothetical protein